MDSILRLLSLDGIHPALAALVIAFYATFLVWLVFGVVAARVRRRIGATNLDGMPIPSAPPRPEFTVENKKEKEEVAARAASYLPPSARGAVPLAGVAAARGPSRGILRLAGFLSLLLGLGFIGLLIYSLVSKSSLEPLEFFSKDAWHMLLTTHWVVIVFTAIRVAVLVFGVRDLATPDSTEA